jgi:hypothetical protein
MDKRVYDRNETQLGTCPGSKVYSATQLIPVVAAALFDPFVALALFELPYELECGSHHTSNVYRCH